LKRWADILAWIFFGLALLCLAAWPLMVWWGMNSGLPFGPATLETLPYPIGALVFWIIARGLKLSTDLPPGRYPGRYPGGRLVVLLRKMAFVS
jgi:hypothetical protein